MRRSATRRARAAADLRAGTARPASSAAVDNGAPRTPSGRGRGRAGERTNAMCSVPSSADVVEELAAPGEEPRVLATADRLAERARGSHGGRGYLWKAAARSEAAAVPPPRRRADRVSGGRDRAAARAAALARGSPTASSSRWSTSSPTATASCCPTCRCTATSEDRPHHPYTPEWLTEVLAGFLHDTCGPRPLVAGPRRRRAARAARDRRAARARPSKLVLLPNRDAHQAGARRARAGGAGRSCARAVVPGFDRALARAGGARAAPEPRRPPHRHRRARRARPGPPRADGPRRQRQPRPLVGEGRAPLAARRAARPARRLPGDATSRSCCCGPTRTPSTRSRSPRRRSTCCPTPSCASCSAPAS